MHELSVTESILEIALRHAHSAKAQRITGLYIVLGQLTSMVDDSVQFYWDIIAKETLAQGARLHFKRIPAELECQDCSSRYGLSGSDMACPECGGSQVRVIAGHECYVEAIEVET